MSAPTEGLVSVASNVQPQAISIGSRAAKGKTVLIDNYDSFTYNVVQFLAEAGADLVVFRNDKITLEEIEALNPANIVISPGPGHPLHDSGISIPCIKHFAGKIPILGVCMGLQSIYSAYTGVVEFAGEIVHGKTSEIAHDGKGLYAGLPAQGVIGTRYHSLAAQLPSLPKELVVTSKTASGVVMGIRHTRYTVEAVQYHPESILSVGGREMMVNFLSWTGGTWDANPQAKVDAAAIERAESTTEPVLAMASTEAANGQPTPAAAGSVGTILERIHVQRLKDIAATKAIPGFSQRDLDIALSLHLAPPLINFPERLQRHASRGLPGVMAEMKRASPSKGDIDPTAHAGAQALAYARGGASVISVLTEPKWFKGTMHDLSLARRAVDNLPDRPAILRKDFIVDTYQIAEARLAGADTVLLIVAMLTDEHLKELYDYSLSLGMEPLVEVNNPEEMTRAIRLGAKVVGVNNRNLHDFNVDMETTSRLADAANKGGVILCALSGISGRSDVAKYLKEGVGAVLVGEALMRAKDKRAFIHDLLGLPSTSTAVESLPGSVVGHASLVKICGLSTVEAAVTAAEAGADMLGMILAPGTKRTVSLEQAAEIIKAVRSLPAFESAAPVTLDADAVAGSIEQGVTPEDWFSLTVKKLRSRAGRRPLLVGVFRDQPLAEVASTAERLGLDVVQLHGRSEGTEWAKFLPGRLVIRVFSVKPGAGLGKDLLREVSRPGYHHIAALDTAAAGGDGGTGVSFDWSIANQIRNADPLPGVVGGSALRSMPVLLAGGLTAENVAQAIKVAQPFAVDTSSGVETDGNKDLAKIKAFVLAARTASSLA
ncbi:putative anthranilate synthase component II [Mycosarcoma maydis]|uniref:Multifunctional tryptophan biosynthesis protein n=1 Tax=Mycosarcoma maydis TaxID=5270 RepID=A0A0D1CTN3_MYCMD|nr:putative anthranilate synthase component II [Ustilago maydis 521]KIS69858.1 putative anthranilate synthase component II [Ustilago maydis 521]|eukprot:XP_011388676.1 putative anthranilate synthase component II [Ustilago maydis 521]